mgnify:CR=1 FL=1
MRVRDGRLPSRTRVRLMAGAVTGTGNVATATPIQTRTDQPQTTVAVVQTFAAGCITIPAAAGTRRLQDTATIATGVAVDQVFLVITTAYILIPTLMVFLTLVVRSLVNRVINIVVALVYAVSIAASCSLRPR